jgi:hypothetical protein
MAISIMLKIVFITYVSLVEKKNMPTCFAFIIIQLDAGNRAEQGNYSPVIFNKIEKSESGC